MFNVTVAAKFLTHAKIKYMELQLILSLMCVDKFTAFCHVLKRCTQKRIGSFFLPRGVYAIDLTEAFDKVGGEGMRAMSCAALGPGPWLSIPSGKIVLQLHESSSFGRIAFMQLALYKNGWVSRYSAWGQTYVNTRNLAWGVGSDHSTEKGRFEGKRALNYEV